MNRLTVFCEKKKNEDGEYYDIRFLIDGRNLIELAREFEMPYAVEEGKPHLAGSYIYNYHLHYTEEFLLGREDAHYGKNNDKTEMVVCECGCEGCWPLAAKILVADKDVTWGDFEQPHRPDWDYEGFGPFVFDRQQYLEEIRKINTTPLVPDIE